MEPEKLLNEFRKREREMEPEKLLNKIQTFVECHPAKNHLYYFAHQHRMTFSHDKFANEYRTLFEEQIDDEIPCSGCSKPIEHAMYGCPECQIFLHKACAELPTQIEHYPYDKWPHLTLAQDFSQNPPLVLAPEMSQKECSCCNLPISGADAAAYSCKQENCDVILHKFCLELPPEIQHPRHPSHSLLLNYNSVDGSSKFYCAACSKDHKGLNYHCKRCDYNLGVRCFFKEAAAVAASSRSDTDGAQGHVLTFFRKPPSHSKRDACFACGDGFNSRQPIFRCEQCDFSLHSYCVLPFAMSALPQTFRSNFHGHPLILTNYFAKRDEILAHQICDVCSQRIFPVLSFYYCAGCDFAEDLTCALRQMEISFAHKLGEFVLDTSPVVIKNPALTVSEIIQSITEDDQKKKLNDAVKEATREMVGAARRQLQLTVDQQQDDDSSGSTDHKETLAQIMEIFESKREQVPRSGLRYYETRSQVGNVNGYIISKHLVPVLQVLLNKYGDFSAESTLRPKGKTFVFTVLCAAIYSICNTKDAEINEAQLFNSWDCFKIAQHAGFKVEFAFERLRNAMLAYFGLQDSTTHTSPALDELDNDMKRLNREVQAQQEKCAQRLATLLSNSVDMNDSIEIVGENKVLNSWPWDEYVDKDPCHERVTWELVLKSEREYLGSSSYGGEISEQEMQTKSSNLSHEGQTETLKLITPNAKVVLTSDWQKNLMNKIKTFFKKKRDEVIALVQNDDRAVACSKCKQLVKDRNRGCTSCAPKSGDILPPEWGFHHHTMRLFRGFKDKTNKKVKDEILCIACDLPVSDATDATDEIYNCNNCYVFLHKFCVQFPSKINHPLHPAHPLMLDKDSERFKKVTCNACGEKCRGCGYSCQSCNFYLEVQCLHLEPTVQSRSHGKVLLFQEERPTRSPLHSCFACGEKIPGPPFLRCAPCNISLHIRCPLPSTITRTFHEHTLALIPCYIDETSEKNDCNFCTKKLDFGHPAYYCETCGYPSHINCAICNVVN